MQLTGQANAVGPRVMAVDWTRGMAMIFMMLDHVSGGYYAHYVAPERRSLASVDYTSTLQFATRFSTHPCVPAFLFLAGTALSLSIARRRDRGQSDWSIDSHLLIRGLILFGLDTISDLRALLHTWPTFRLDLEILGTIGMCIWAMILLRRLPTWLLIVLSAIIATTHPLVSSLEIWQSSTALQTLGAWLLENGYSTERISVLYPLIPWLAVMMLGWCFGRCIGSNPSWTGKSMIQRMAVLGTCSLVLFVVIRLVNGYLGLLWFWNLVPDRGRGVIDLLHLSKYPPDLTFLLCSLGIMTLSLAVFCAIEQFTTWGQRFWMRPLSVFGQTALFYYLLHKRVAIYYPLRVFGERLVSTSTMTNAYLAWIVGLVAMYPICYWYLAYKKTHKNLLTTYI